MEQQNIIRSVLEADLPAIGRLYTGSWQRTYRGLVPDGILDEMTAEKSREKWEHYLAREENGMFALECSGAVAGFAACRPLTERKDSALLDSLHVAQEVQGGGWGRKLIARAARWARENRFGELVVFVVQGNRRAEQLYRRMGAEELYAFRDPVDGAPSWALVWRDLAHLEREFT